MLPEARQLLRKFYRPWNVDLADLLKDPFYATWSNAEAKTATQPGKKPSPATATASSS